MKAMKQALEALEDSIDTVRHEYESDWRHGLPTRAQQLAGMKEKIDAHAEAITALRQAIQEAALQNITDFDQQAEQAQPVAMRYDFDGYGYQYIDNGSGSDWQTRHGHAEPLYTTAPPQRQPLTDEEMDAALRRAGVVATYEALRCVGREVEAAHGIKG